jgi:MoxR-like ATPase
MTNLEQTGEKVLANVERVIVGKHHEVRSALVALLCRGHLLIEDVPGTGKTVLAKAIARSLGCSFRRIQFTPDLLPSDVTGPLDLQPEDQEFEFRPGPIMSQVVLADEINRATPKTQSSLLESMEERQATIDGTTYAMPDPFLVIATQNPIEYEGTVRPPGGPARPVHAPDPPRLPAAARGGRDPRRAEAAAPARRARRSSARSTSCADADRDPRHLRRPDGRRLHRPARRRDRDPPDVYLGASPRGSIALYRAGQALAGLLGRDYVIPDDIKALAEPALAHRLIIKTSSSIHDVQSATSSASCSTSTPIDGVRRPAARRPAASSRAGPSAASA